MPWIVDYEQVLAQMRGQGLRDLYYNSGAFGFPQDAVTESVGWIGGEDPTLRQSARDLACLVPAPYVEELTSRVVSAWRELLPGPVWYPLYPIRQPFMLN